MILPVNDRHGCMRGMLAQGLECLQPCRTVADNDVIECFYHIKPH